MAPEGVLEQESALLQRELALLQLESAWVLELVGVREPQVLVWPV